MLNRPPNRRTFMAGLAASAALVSAQVPAISLAAQQTPADQTPFKISLAQWSLHKKLYAGDLENLDFAKTASEQFGIQAIEYVNQFFADHAEDQDYLQQMIDRAGDVGVQSLLIMVDGEGQLGNPNSAGRTKAVENHYRWVTAAKTLGCHSIRVNAGSAGKYHEQAKLAADGLSRLSQFAAEHDINVIVENHGGLSSNGQWLAHVIRTVDRDNCGTLPDFGNFRIAKGKAGQPDKEYDRYIGVAALMPFAKAVSAKSHVFDAAGNETKTDYSRMMQIVLDAGYDGYVGVEFEGDGDEFEGIAATQKLLQRCQQELRVGG